MKSSTINVFVAALCYDEFVAELVQAGYKEVGSLTYYDYTTIKLFEISVNRKLFSVKPIWFGSDKWDMTSYDFTDLFL